MSNFDFLKDFDSTLWKLGNRIEKQVNISPSGVKADATTFLEYILKQYLVSVNIKYNSRKSFKDQIDDVFEADGIQYGFKEKIKKAYYKRNEIHDDFEDIEKNEFATALALHKTLFYIAKKYYRDSDEYDEYKGVPKYVPPEIDLTDEEIELLEVPDFDEIVDFSYDYCVVCGEPNHSSYSIFCENCNREIDNANNFISIRNSFGKNSKFTKEDLIEYGIHEGYVNALISSLNKSDLFKVKGRFIEFNNSKLDSYILKIDKFIRVSELITQFREDVITPAEIKQTNEYKQGSFKQFPFYQFYKVINEEIINKFERDLLSTENIHDSIEYTTISQKDLTRWYDIQLNRYRKNNSNESFEMYNNLLIDEYFNLKREGLSESEIESKLNLTDEMLEFFEDFDPEFRNRISEIKKGLILRALSENKTKDEAIEFAGITPKEYDDIIKYSEFKGNDFYSQYQKEINQRKETLLISLTDHDLISSCEKSKISVDMFYEWYDKADFESEFFTKSTKILMNKFLDERSNGKTKSEAAKSIGLKESLVDYWLKRKVKIFDKFKDDNLKVTVDLVLKGFKNNQTKKQIGDEVEISVNEINRFLSLGKRGSEIYRKLYDYYENEVIPKQLSRFLDEIKNKPLNKALKRVDLTKDELNYCYETNEEFHDEYLEVKCNKYIRECLSKTKHETSLGRADLSEEEYLQSKDKIDAIILKEKMKDVKRQIENDAKTDAAAKHAGVTVDDIYDWYYKGKSDEEYREFSEFFYDHYIEPNVLWVNKLLDQNKSIEQILKIFTINFTKKDFEIWQKEGLINKENIVVNLKDDNEDDETISVLESHGSKLYANESKENELMADETNSELFNKVNNDEEKKDLFFNMKKPSESASILKKDERDIEKLKKEMGIEDKK